MGRTLYISPMDMIDKLFPYSEKNPDRTALAEPCRLVNEWGSMTLDIYPPLLYAVLYKQFSKKEIQSLADQLEASFPSSPLLIQDRSVRPFTTVLEKGDLLDEMTVTEERLEFYLHPRRGQNPGFFTDMREGRRIIREIIRAGLPGSAAAGAAAAPSVLNLFAYTCSLSVVALSAGAGKVVNIDMNKRSLDIGRRNHRLNHGAIPGGYRNQATFLPHDIFKSFGKLGREGPYDLIIADPPPSQKGSFDLDRGYPRLLRRLSEMLNPCGTLLLTLNSPDRGWEDFEGMVRESLGKDPDVCTRWERIDPPKDFTPPESGHGLKLLRIEL